MNLKQIQELIKFVAKSGATEVDLEMGDVKISIKSPPKGKIITDLNSPVTNLPQTIVSTQPSQPVTLVSAPNIATKPIAAVDPNDDVKNNKAESPSANHITIKSPIIGTFYRRPSPEKDPFINVGDRIEQGAVVGIVEAMKLFNEIESEVSGTIVKVLVDDMSPVEYDQPLFLVDPN